MSSFCPPEKSLDVKKSSYKKMAKFLEQIEKVGCKFCFNFNILF